MDAVEKRIIIGLNLPIYKEYKKLHTSEEIRRLHFNNSEEKQTEYGFSNLTTLYRLSDSYYQLNLLKSLPNLAYDLPEFFISHSAVLTGFFLSLRAVFNSLANEINILFNKGKIDDESISFTEKYFDKIKDKLPEMLKERIYNVIQEKWFKEIKEYRNRLAHRSILPLSLKSLFPHKFSLLRSDLSFEKVLKVHLGKELYKIPDDFCSRGENVAAQCSFYFDKTRDLTKDIWEILYNYLKECLKK